MKRFPLILLVIMLGVFVYGLVHLFQLRFQSGDVYPEYSSLRADPLGAKAFYESLDRLLSTGRNRRSLEKLASGRSTTLFYLGTRPPFIQDDRVDLKLMPEEFKALEMFVSDGGRLVISFFPTFQKPVTNRFGPGPGAGSGPSSSGAKGNTKAQKPMIRPKQNPVPAEEEFQDARRVSIREVWGLGYGYDNRIKEDKGVYQASAAAKTASAPAELPETLSCHTALYFEQLTNSWQIIYARRKTEATIIERKLGSGTIVLCADSYPFSNEALLKERSAPLLAWMVGPNRQVLFEETHLGVEESPGIAALARQYRLHGLFAGLILLAGLYLWKNMTSFLPPYEETASGEQRSLVSGKDSAAGFVNLLRRNLPGRELLAICLSEWKKSCGRQQAKAKLEQIQTIIDQENQRPAAEQNPISTYQAIAEVLRRVPRSAPRDGSVSQPPITGNLVPTQETDKP